ncbi:MAG: GNAT family N-acetyltransferase [Armatimonadetes bacterium]|nr:GNAT family N-acetyltransferase [Armatimonadota bacterium]
MDVRVEVFVVEQGCPPEEESDEFDAVALHFVAVAGDRVVGTARAYEMDGCAKIGRVAVKRSHRGQGIGAALMEAAHAWARESGFSECILHAQTPVIGFYASLGYRAEGEEFYEADIPHYRMRRKIT